MNKRGQTLLIVVVLVVLVIFLAVVYFVIFRERSSSASSGNFSSFILTSVDSSTKAKVGSSYSVQKILWVCREPIGFCKAKKIGRNQKGCFVWDVKNCSTNETVRWDSSEWVVDNSFFAIIGNISASDLEVFDKAMNGSDYLLTTSAPGYYKESKICSEGMTECLIELDRKPSFVFGADSEKVFFNVDEGVIKGGVLCIAWEHPIIFFELKDLEGVEKPEGLRIFYDRCFTVPEIFVNSSYFFRKEGYGQLKLLLMGDFIDSGNLTVVKQL
jgi:hypothetical protein